MAWVLLLEECSVVYRGRAERTSEGESFLVAIKDDGCVAFQRLTGGAKPVFWNGAGVVQLAHHEEQVRLRAHSFAGEVLECAGRAVLRRSFEPAQASGQRRVFVTQDLDLPPAPDPALLRSSRDRPLTPDEDRVLTALKTWRTKESRSRKVSPFVVASNGCLEAIVRARPRSLEDLARIDGLGPVRVEQYGERFLKMVAELEAPG
jgi:superfamily II DNA helicase RecQ